MQNENIENISYLREPMQENQFLKVNNSFFKIRKRFYRIVRQIIKR